ncbi:hypothetical protein [Croceimicrobium sp.]|uniref:hypothetical protein n=1 Tax=Croceimicrobium sp. TaxID=2828340 RepID=UPI003BAAAD2C
MLKNQKQHPYLLLWIFAILFPLISLSNLEGDGWTINLHDTYYVISQKEIIILHSVYLVLLGGLYWLMRKRKLSNALNIFHGLACFLIPMYLILMNRNEWDPSTHALFYKLYLIAIALLIWLLAQIGFVINLLLGFRKNAVLEENT